MSTSSYKCRVNELKIKQLQDLMTPAEEYLRIKGKSKKAKKIFRKK